MRKENELPSSIEAEKAVLGSIILEPTLWDSLSVEIEEDDFKLVPYQRYSVDVTYTAH